MENTNGSIWIRKNLNKTAIYRVRYKEKKVMIFSCKHEDILKHEKDIFALTINENESRSISKFMTEVRLNSGSYAKKKRTPQDVINDLDSIYKDLIEMQAKDPDHKDSENYEMCLDIWIKMREIKLLVSSKTSTGWGILERESQEKRDWGANGPTNKARKAAGEKIDEE